MAEYDKSVLLELSKQAPNNRCMDCNSPHPQWASVNHGIFICLECSGEHRSLGVHISFVRSLTMDKWTTEQINKMQKGGNAKATEFFNSSPEYKSGMTITQKYNTHFASQYREKLLCEAEGRTFVPSAAPPPSESTSSLRKPRSTTAASGGRASPNPISRSGTPVTNASSLGGQSNPYATTANAASEQKTANENYFASLGDANAARPADLPPSQGGRYAGFGSSPLPTSPGANAGSANHPSNMISSRALPTLSDLQNDPLKAFGKGWGLFSSTVSLATKQINEQVIQPGLAKVQDPELQTHLQGYYNKGGEFISYGLQKGQSVLGDGIKQGGTWAKSAGIDTSYVDRFGGPSHSGYDQVSGNALDYNDGPALQPHQTSLESQEGGYADLPTPPVAKMVTQQYASYGSTSNARAAKANTNEDDDADFFDSQLKQASGSNRSNSVSASKSPEEAFKTLNIGSTAPAAKRPLGKKGLGAVRSATPPAAKKANDDDEWAKFD